MPEVQTALSAKRLRACRENARETLEQIGRLVGVNKSTVLRWERGDTAKINLPTMHRLAEHYRVGSRWLMGLDDTGPGARAQDFPPARVTQLPVYGTVTVGADGEIAGEIVDYVPAENRLLAGGTACLWFSVCGDSMSPVLNEGDLALVSRRSPVGDGAYALTAVDGGKSQICRVVHGGGGLELHSVNPYYPVRRFEQHDPANVRIVGAVLESRRRYKL